MGRQYRSPRRGASLGAGSVVSNVTILSSSSTAIQIPNYGITDMSTWTAGEYVLDTPEAGSRKVLVRAQATSAAVVVRGSTTGTVTIGGQTTAFTQITFNATVDMCAVLIGINSTHWAIEAMYPPTAANSTGIVVAGT